MAGGIVEPAIRLLSEIESGPAEIYSAGSTIPGFEERKRRTFDIVYAGIYRVFVDDEELVPAAAGRFEWTPGFVAGRVRIVVECVSNTEFIFHAEVGSASHKASGAQFEAMIGQVRAFRASLLLGDSSGTASFGDDPGIGGLDALVRLARMQAYAPSFLREIASIATAPHRSLAQTNAAVSLMRARRLNASALRDPRVAAVTAGSRSGSAIAERLRVTAPTPYPTFDTPSNRAIKALLTKVLAQSRLLLETVREEKIGGAVDEQRKRRARRERFLESLTQRVQSLLVREPFASTSRLETSSTGLTQISAEPRYSRAYRYGTKALWLGVEGRHVQDYLNISPTWGIYETWCYVELVARLSGLMASTFAPRRKGMVNAVESFGWDTPNGGQVEIHFQASFPAAGSASVPDKGWSISRSRIPDIVVVVRAANRHEFVVLDAKYRRHRDNVLDAMESAHIYHDALRIGNRRPAFCVLLLPATTDVKHLDAPEFLRQHGVGTICEFAIDGSGVDRCIDLLKTWITQAVERMLAS